MPEAPLYTVLPELLMTHPLIISIILNKDRKKDSLECLASLEKNAYPKHKVIFLDAGSGDGSVEAVRASYPAAQIVSLQNNKGYAGNNNVGIQLALEQGADWVFLLNDDVVLDATCLARLVEVGESDSRIGIVGPMVYHHNEPTIIQSAGGLLGRYWESIHLAKNEADTGQHPAPHAVEWLSGCAIMVRRQVIEQVGMLDERFFAYWEETEWCLRAAKSGWRIMHVPQAKLWHKDVQRNYAPSPAFTYYNTRNRFLMYAKHKAPLPVWLHAWQQTLRTLISWTVKPKWRAMHRHRNAMWRGMIDFLRHRWGEK